MKQTLALARITRADVQAALQRSRTTLAAAAQELTTIARRGDLARQIGDDETVAVAERFAESQRATIGVLERKVAVQEEELALHERAVAEMEADLRSATGVGPMPAGAAAGTAGAAASSSDPADFRSLDDAARVQAADDRLAELKRRMGKS